MYILLNGLVISTLDKLVLLHHAYINSAELCFVTFLQNEQTFPGARISTIPNTIPFSHIFSLLRCAHTLENFETVELKVRKRSSVISASNQNALTSTFENVALTSQYVEKANQTTNWKDFQWAPKLLMRHWGHKLENRTTSLRFSFWKERPCLCTLQKIKSFIDMGAWHCVAQTLPIKAN